MVVKSYVATRVPSTRKISAVSKKSTSRKYRKKFFRLIQNVPANRKLKVNAQKFYQVFKDQALPGNCFQKDGGRSGIEFPLFSLKLCFPVGVICYSAREKVEQDKCCHNYRMTVDRYVKPGIAGITED